MEAAEGTRERLESKRYLTDFRPQRQKNGETLDFHLTGRSAPDTHLAKPLLGPWNKQRTLVYSKGLLDAPLGAAQVPGWLFYRGSFID